MYTGIGQGVYEKGVVQVRNWRKEAEEEKIETEFNELTAEQLQECLKAITACGCDSFVKESANIAIQSGRYPYFLKLEVLAMKEKLKEPSLL